MSSMYVGVQCIYVHFSCMKVWTVGEGNQTYWMYTGMQCTEVFKVAVSTLSVQ